MSAVLNAVPLAAVSQRSTSVVMPVACTAQLMLTRESCHVPAGASHGASPTAGMGMQKSMGLVGVEQEFAKSGVNRPNSGNTSRETFASAAVYRSRT